MRLELVAARQVVGLDDPPAAHEVERRPHLLDRHAGQLGPGQPVERQLQLVGVVALRLVFQSTTR